VKVDLLQDQTLQAIGAYMSRLSQRLQIVSSNLANIDTPEYKTRDVSFHATMQELLAEAPVPLSTTRPEHDQGWLPVPAQAMSFEVQGLPSRLDRNNVDLDSEMLKLSQTDFGYSMMAQILKGKFRTIATSINEGRA
jgi:flagellar basal-body rod protein FlgB